MSDEALTAAPEAPAPAPSEAPAPEAVNEPAAAPDTEENKAVAAEKALNDDLRKAFRNANKSRDETGKFAPADPDKVAKVEQPAEAEAKPAEEPKQAAPVVPPPASWSKEAAAEWNKLPPTVQQYVQQRETEAHQAIGQLSRYAKAVEPIAKVVEPHVDRITAAGDHPASYIEKMFAADQWLARDPVGAIKALAESYNVDLNAIADPFALPADPHQQQLSAQLQAALRELDFMKRQLGDTRQRVEAREATEYAARQSSYEREVDAFAADKPDFGTLAADIETNIALLKRSNPNLGAKEMLQEAYDRARWANPTTRSQLIARQTAEAEKKRIEEAKAAANTARRSAAINVNGSVPQRGQLSHDDDLRAIWKRNHA